MVFIVGFGNGEHYSVNRSVGRIHDCVEVTLKESLPPKNFSITSSYFVELICNKNQSY